ncbi:hypothetical protein YC2023_012896 [Brassica napus]
MNLHLSREQEADTAQATSNLTHRQSCNGIVLRCYKYFFFTQRKKGTFVEGIKEEVILSPPHALSLIAAGEEVRKSREEGEYRCRVNALTFDKEGTHPLGNANVVAVHVTTRRPAGTLYKKLRLWRRHLKVVRTFFLGTG